MRLTNSNYLGLVAALALACSKLASAGAEDGPLLHPGDSVLVTVYNHPELSTTTTVASDGSISVPVAGTVPAANATTLVVRARLQDALAAYLHHPAVGVRMLQQGKSIFVTGAYVGVLPYEPGETVNSAIGSLRNLVTRQASPIGGIDPTTTAYDLRNVRVEHDGRIVGPINVESLERSGAAGLALSPGDRIMLADKPVRVDIEGDVKLPGPVYLYRGQTLNQALEEAGGLNPTASTSHIRLDRDAQATFITSAGPEFAGPALNGDVITMLPAPRINVVGSVITPGTTVVQSMPTLLNAIYYAGGPAKNADLKRVKVIHQGIYAEYSVKKLVTGDLSQNPVLADGDTVFVPQGRAIDPALFLEALGAVSSARYIF